MACAMQCFRIYSMPPFPQLSVLPLQAPVVGSGFNHTRDVGKKEVSCSVTL